MNKIREEFIKEFERLANNLKARNEKWITIKPHGEESDDYRRIKLEDGETPKEAIDRIYKKDNKKEKTKEELKAEKKQLFLDILKAKKEGNKELHSKLLERYNRLDRQLKGKKETYPEQKEQEKQSKPKVKLAGIDAGVPMSREQADNKNPNPNFMIKNGCSTNCQTCVVAYEARLRGYNVQALGNYKNSTIEDLSRRTNIAWIDPQTGKHPDYIIDANVKNYKSCYTWLDKEIKQDSRYTLQFGWKGRRHSGHIISIDKDSNGNLRLYDPQNAKTITDKQELLKYFQRFKYQMSTYGIKIQTPPKLLRIDNMDFNTDVVDRILEKST